MTKKAKQRSKSQARGHELTDQELERAVGGAGIAVGGTTLYKPAPSKPAAQNPLAARPDPRDWRTVAAANGIDDPMGSRDERLMEIDVTLASRTG